VSIEEWCTFSLSISSPPSNPFFIMDFNISVISLFVISALFPVSSFTPSNSRHHQQIHQITAPPAASSQHICRFHSLKRKRRVASNSCSIVYQRINDEGENDDVENEGTEPQSSRAHQRTSFLSDRIQNADPLEVRLDATLASIYVFCRFLIFDVTTGAKDHPGWELKDVIWLLQTTSSAIVLATLWTGVGLLTRMFEDTRYKADVQKVIGTTVLSAPIWLALEVQFGWPPAGILYAEGSDDLLTLILTGSVGLCTIMLLNKYLTSGWR